MSTPSEEALKAEIARLSGAISAHKSGKQVPATSRGNSYVNPNHKPLLRPAFRSKSSIPHRPSEVSVTVRPPIQPREVVIDGVAFQSSKNSLVRKDLAPSVPKPVSFKQVQAPRHVYSRKYPGTRSIQRPYKSKASRRIPRSQNMTLENGRKPVRVGRKTKSMKYVDKQCPRFSTTGVCTKGRICCYKHDPAKIAICWPFLNGTCPNTVESCSLSHNPTPERTPLCVHFANNGRCKNGSDCLFPHVRVGPRKGICRDFAVLGFCERGIDCEYQHVRECPDFAEKGTCPNTRCKLPHVIRANQRRGDAVKQTNGFEATTSVTSTGALEKSPQDEVPKNGFEGNIGDEYISLTFHESEDSEEDEGGSEEADSENEEDADADSDEEEDEKSDDANSKEAELEVHP